MFRRTTKNPLEKESSIASLYGDELSFATPYKFGSRKIENLPEAHTRLFEVSANEEKKTPLHQPFQTQVKEQPETTLGEGVTFKGELIFEKLLKIDGNFEGELI